MPCTLPRIVLLAAIVCTLTASALADAPEFTPQVTDLTVFKDGHALVLTRGLAKLEDGWCRTREVPVPILGAFWTFAPDEHLRIDAVQAGMVDAEHKRPCLTFDDMLQANTGKRATIVEQFEDAASMSHEGVILGILQDDSRREVEASRSVPAGYSPYGHYQPSQEIRETRESKDKTLASFVMLKTDDGIRLIARNSIRSIMLAEREPATTYTDKELVRQIAVRVLKDDKPAIQAEVGFVYVQKGVRWIPDYRIELLDNGSARVRLQATIINELADIDNANLRLVIGVPSFLMKDERSPMALRDTAVQLSSYFAPPSQGRGGESRSNYASFSNAIQSQVAAPQEPSADDAASGPNVPSEGQQEDLFLYHKPGFSLKKGHRAVVTLAEVTVPYEDIYTWDVPPVPPKEVLERAGQDQQKILATLTGARAVHAIRLSNKGSQPWTTGPVTILKGTTVLGQQLMTYTSPGNKVDIAVTTAADLHTSREESEVRRDASVQIDGNSFAHIFLHGKLVVTNFKAKPVRMQITRKLLGAATNATGDGKITQANRLEDLAIPAEGYPWWYTSWAWPWWWQKYNPLSEIRWSMTIPAGGSATVEYDWHYYFRPW